MEDLSKTSETIQEFEGFRKQAGFVSQREKRQQRDLELYGDYQLLVSQGKLKGEIVQFLMHKYDIGSQGTIYVIINRVEKQRKEGGV